MLTDNRQQTTDKPIALPPAAHARTRGNYDETYDEIYDVIAMKTVSKCLARMKDCWDPEFKPSVGDHGLSMI